MNKKKIKIALKILGYVLLFKLFKKRTPIIVGFRITNKCNANCKYCYLNKEKLDELSTNEIKKMVDEMAELGAARIGFMGGEALLREDFEEILDYTNSKGIHTSLVSNGYLVPSKVNIIRKLDCLILSFDGRKRNHDKYRGKGSFEKVMKAIKIISKENVPLLTISVLSEDSLNDIDFILNKAKKYGFYCHFNILSGENINLPKNLMEKAIMKLIKREKEGLPVILSMKTLVRLLNHFENVDSNSQVNQEYTSNCFAGNLMCNIEPSGMLRACNIGKIAKDSLNAKKLGFREAFEKLKTPDYAGCANKCTCTVYAEYSNMLSLNPKTILKWSKPLKIFN